MAHMGTTHFTDFPVFADGRRVFVLESSASIHQAQVGVMGLSLQASTITGTFLVDEKLWVAPTTAVYCLLRPDLLVKVHISAKTTDGLVACCFLALLDSLVIPEGLDGEEIAAWESSITSRQEAFAYAEWTKGWWPERSRQVREKWGLSQSLQ